MTQADSAPHPVQPHLEETGRWLADLPTVTLNAAELEQTAIVAVDILNGFTREGPLGSPRVEGIIAPSVALLESALAAGLPAGRIALMTDNHPADAEEFRAFPPHCIRGSSEAQWADEFLALPQYDQFAWFEKNSVASHHTSEFGSWLDDLTPRTIVALGDVSDLCLYSLALHLVTRSQHHSLGQRILIPASAVQTWDAPDHPAELYHPIFLRQLARIGAEVVAEVRFE